MNHIAALFSCLAKAKLNINLAKCEVVWVTVTYVGQLAEHGQVFPVSTKVELCMSHPCYD